MAEMVGGGIKPMSGQAVERGQNGRAVPVPQPCAEMRGSSILMHRLCCQLELDNCWPAVIQLQVDNIK